MIFAKFGKKDINIIIIIIIIIRNDEQYSHL